MFKRTILILSLICSLTQANAQMLDTLTKIFSQEPRIVFRLDNRNSFITTQNAKILGFKVGLEFDDRLRLGLAYHWLASKINEEVIVYNNVEIPETYNGRLKFRYLGLFTEYAFYRNRKWEFSLPLQFGFGSSFYKYYNEADKRRTTDHGPMVLLEPGVEANYNILSWLGFGLGIGYRVMLVKNKAIDEKFSSPFYVIKVNLGVKELYLKGRTLFAK